MESLGSLCQELIKRQQGISTGQEDDAVKMRNPDTYGIRVFARHRNLTYY